MTSSSTSTNPAVFVDFENARYDDQKAVMQESEDAGVCPFCLENLKKFHKEPIMLEGKFWVITKNQWPYDFTQLHIMAIYKKHITTLQELDPNAGSELFALFAEIAEKEHIPGGGIVMRFGNTNYSAGSVNHLHAQLVVPDIEKPNFQPVRIKIGKGNTKTDQQS